MIRTGIGFDVHAFATGRRLVLGGVEIPHEQGLLGHSDADVLCHALSDALLGSVGDGDIGQHFPDTDERWRGADSLVLLAEVARRVRAAGAQINNVDVTVMAEAPKLAPHILSMRERLAEALAVSVGQVSVKATTTERLGFTGRGEGMAAMAIATVEMQEE
jgi:2-C-methyl-D-erythritol 2,4-cyclodiphosphate synthase